MLELLEAHFVFVLLFVLQFVLQFVFYFLFLLFFFFSSSLELQLNCVTMLHSVVSVCIPCVYRARYMTQNPSDISGHNS